MYTLTGNYKADQVHVPPHRTPGAVGGALWVTASAFAPLVSAYVLWATLAAVVILGVHYCSPSARTRGAIDARRLALALRGAPLARQLHPSPRKTANR